MTDSLQDFVDYCRKHIKGDEKGEAQIFLDHFFTALGYKDGLKGAGADCEFRIKDPKKKTTSFADLVWKPRVLIEMKKRDEDLSLHYQQALSYWMQLVPNRPQYVILCNFDEFWIYDLNEKLYDPLDKIALEELPKHKGAFSFLLPVAAKPVFLGKHEDITQKAAEKISEVYKSMTKRGITQKDALRYCLQCIVALFAEDTNLLPDNIFTRIINECIDNEKEADGIHPIPKSYDLIGGLFREMNNPDITPTGRYKGVDYFNGGLFREILPIELYQHEINMLDFAAAKNWTHVNPAIFGTIFEQSMEKEERHIRGAHYTHETDIMKIVDPVIVRPWTKKIEAADNLNELYELIKELRKFKVLDPACGSGNFLFIAFKEMKLLEKQLINRLRAKSTKPEDAKRLKEFLIDEPFVSIRQFYGIDIKPDAVELAKVTLMVAKELWVTQNREDWDNEKALPLDNLDQNIKCEDALLTDDGRQRQWPEADAIIGNPPYQSKRRMQEEFGIDYLNKIREAYPNIPGRADFCVFWFNKAHQNLKKGQYAGLVGTDTIKQNFSREGSLDYIVNHEGTIIEAVSTEPWSGEAAVDVAIVCWKKGKESGEKKLYYPDKNGNLVLHNIPFINSSLSLSVDLISAHTLTCNKEPKKCFQGQTHGHEGFLLTPSEAKKFFKINLRYRDILKPYLNGDELVSKYHSQPRRFVIDFTQVEINDAASFNEVYKKIESEVLPDRQAKAKEQQDENNTLLKQKPDAKVNKHHINFYNKWWQLSYGREELLNDMTKLRRYVTCPQTLLRPIFEFVSPDISPSQSLYYFGFEDDYSFGVIQSIFHWEWIKERGATLGGTYRYNTTFCWDTFPWPQSPTQKQIEKVAKASRSLRDARNKVMNEHHYSLRDLYRIVEQPGKNPIKDLHAALDKAVMEVYGFDENVDILKQLLDLNLDVHEKEQRKEPVQAPGLPDWIPAKEKFVSEDCVRFEG